MYHDRKPAILLLGFSLFVFATFSQPVFAVEKSPIKVGLINQEKEQVSFPELSAAARATVRYINEELGGVDGHPLELDVCLTGDSAESAVACATDFANKPDVPMVIDATYNSGAVNRILLNKKAILTFNVLLEDSTTPNLYTLDGGVLVPVQITLNEAKKAGVKTMSILATDDPETREAIIPLVEMAASSAGIKIVSTIPVGGAVDYTAAITAAEPDKVDALMALIVSGDQCIPFGQALKTLGVGKPIYGNEVCAKRQIVESGAVDGWELPISSDGALSESTPGPDTLKFRDIITKYSEGSPEFGGTAGFAVAHLLAVKSIYEKTGADALSPEAINTVLSKGWTEKLLTYPQVTCPGTAPFMGQCQTSMYWAKVTDGKLGLKDPAPVTVDMSTFSALVGK